MGIDHIEHWIFGPYPHVGDVEYCEKQCIGVWVIRSALKHTVGVMEFVTVHLG